MFNASSQPLFTYLLLAFLLIVFCTPFTCFDEAKAYLADTENVLVHYYLSPLPDDGEACVSIPEIEIGFIVTSFCNPYIPKLSSFGQMPFLHPPENFI